MNERIGEGRHSLGKVQSIEVPFGLRGVIVAETEIGDVRGDEGFYHYRQYSAIELARSHSLEDVWHLVFGGRLPDSSERDRFRQEIAPLRCLSATVRAAAPGIAPPGSESRARPCG